jgi:hypothetical protein
LVDSSENSSNDYPVSDTQQNTQQNIQQEDFSHPSITDFEQVSKIYDYILQQSKKLNMRPLVIFNSMDLKEPLKSKVEALVNIHQEDELNQSTWTAQDLKTATEKARFFTEEWNKIIEDASAQQMDVRAYIGMHYPTDLAKEIITWYQIKTGQLKPFDNDEKLAVTINEISNEEVQQYDEQYDDLTFQQFVQNAREALSEINWQKVGAYLSDGVNNVLYQLAKPGSFIKKTADSIRAVVSLLSLERVDEFSEEYDEQYIKEQEDRRRAEQELDGYLNQHRTSFILNKMMRVANYLDNSGKYKEATEITGVMKKVAQINMAPAANYAMGVPGAIGMMAGQYAAGQKFTPGQIANNVAKAVMPVPYMAAQYVGQLAGQQAAPTQPVAAAPVGGAIGQAAANPNANLTALTGVGLTPRQLLQAQQQAQQAQQQQAQQQKQEFGQNAQAIINGMSPQYGGDINKMIQALNQYLRQGTIGQKLHNDAMYILNMRRQPAQQAVAQQPGAPAPSPTMGVA